MPVVKAQAEMQMPARNAVCCFGSAAMPSERAKTTKPPPRNICRKKRSIVAVSGWALEAATGKRVMRYPAMEKKRKMAPGRVGWPLVR